MRIALLFVVVLASAGCKKSAPVEDPGDMGMGSGSGSSSGSGTGTGTGTGTESGMPDDLRSAVDAYVGALEGIAAAADGAKDCPGMVTALKAASDASLPAMKDFNSFSQEEIETHNVEINEQFGPRIDAAAAMLGEATELCEDDPDVQALLEAMGFK